MHIYPRMRLGKIDQKIFGHSAISNVVRILLLRESGKNREMNIKEVLTVTATKGKKAERLLAEYRQKIKVFKMEEKPSLNLSSTTYQMEQKQQNQIESI